MMKALVHQLKESCQIKKSVKFRKITPNGKNVACDTDRFASVREKGEEMSGNFSKLRKTRKCQGNIKSPLIAL